MLIAQITDIHLGFEPGRADEANLQRLNQVIDTLLSMTRLPDGMIATGDLTEHGAADSYATLRRALERCPWPVWLIPGNHDVRTAFCAAFPLMPVDDGFVHYVVDSGPLRIVMLDTLEEGVHGGSFCERRAAWLEAQLAAAPDRPTLIVAHHPPIETGIDWMTAHAGDAWVGRLAAVVRRHPQIVRIVAGHIHRPIVADWAGTTVWVSPSTAPQVTLELGAVPPMPDDRPMIIAEPPGFSLHLWTGTALVSHAGMADGGPVLARYDDRMRPTVERIRGE